MVNFYDLSLLELKQFLVGHGKEKFRAEQLFRWVYQKGVTDFSQMTNISQDFREEIKNILDFKLPKVVHQADSVDGTRKFLMAVDGGKNIESVLIPNEDRLTLCVSSEVGCAMGCQFCFTAEMGLMRRLNVSEIVGQFLNAQKSLNGTKRITNIVFMGMGEPLDNVDNVTKAIEILHEQVGIGLSKKRITVSTSGIVPQIHRVAKVGARLAVSLNATTNEIRDKVMPINRKYNLEKLLEACKQYYLESKDMITFEYVLLKGINDSIDDAHRIVQLTKNIPSKINLIPFNEHPESGFVRPSQHEVNKFQKTLMNAGKHVLVRRTMGRDIYAACGQLRSEMEKHPQKMSV
ncbi:MAG: 23S rRNA (adenine(2503)-C(2))-methyltransferase RlmN [Oligoflexia bacterium]|nr:23S rRNA (adenine(2503)-C(2))-methyltransferase RlmN [Oligoflexia bacterium]